jgi:type 1 glutamine amidotransferase
MFRAVLCLLAAVAAAPALAADPPKKILLVSSGPDGHPPATHEYVAGLDVLAACLKPVAVIEVTHVKADGPWKEGPDLIGRSDCVVLFLSEGAKWLSADPKRLDAFRQHAKRGGGLVVVHWGMGTREAGPIDAFVELLGGCHGGPDRKYKVLETAAVSVADPTHPITAGVKDFKVNDEFYYKLKFPKEKSKVRPVLLADIDGSKETVAWSFDRPDGGRSFGFSGLHFHDNWKREDYRRLVTQGVLWTAKVPVPAEGLDVIVPESVFKLEKK